MLMVTVYPFSYMNKRNHILLITQTRASLTCFIVRKYGKYEQGNQIGRTDSFLLIPKDWYIENETSFTIIDYQWGNRIIQGIEIPSDFIDNIIVKGADGIITFGMASPLYWTEMATPPLLYT